MNKRYTLLIVFALLLSNWVLGQNTPYTDLYTSSTFTKTVDLSKPVGAIAASHTTTPTGAIVYSIPIAVPPGTNGLAPALSLQYNSQGESSIAGYGWSITGLSAITRGGKNMYYNNITQPVSYTRQDNFYLDGMKINQVTGTTNNVTTDLSVPTREASMGAYYASNSITFLDGFSSEDGAAFSAEMVNSSSTTGDGFFAAENEDFSKIIYYGSPDNPTWFKVILKDGTIMEYGHTADSWLFNDDVTGTMMWRLNRVIDINGNYIDFVYAGNANTDRDYRIKTIKYTGNINTGQAPFNTINFNYTLRNEKNIVYEGGASLVSQYLLSQIQITNESGAVFKTYDLNYGFDNLNSMLKEVLEKGTDNTALNSTIFLYGDKPQHYITATFANFANSTDWFTGDFDGDGRNDVIGAASYTSNGIKYHSSYTVRTNFNAGSYSTLYTKNLATETVDGQNRRRYNFFTNDYDGDGRDDVLTVSSTYSNPHRVLNNIGIYFTRAYNATTGTAFVKSDYTYPYASGLYYRYVNTTTGQFLFFGDFDGNGSQDYILVLENGNDGQFKAFLTSPSTNVVNEEISNFGFGANPTPAFYAKTVAEANQVVPIDVDGDGKSELMATKDGMSYIITIKPQSSAGGYAYTAAVVSQAVIANTARIFPADFNGDKKSDLLYKDLRTGKWFAAISNGISFAGYEVGFNPIPEWNDVDGDDKLMVADFNGDGKTDIFHGYDNGTGGSYFTLYYSKGFNGAPSFYSETYSYGSSITGGTMFPGDFNGDGRTDLMYKPGIATNVLFIYLKPFGKERNLVKVTNGHNQTTSFDYRSLADITDPNFYSRTIPLDLAPNNYPTNYVELPLMVVSSVTAPNGIGGTDITRFSYTDAILNRSGKGFLGFGSVTAQNSSMGTTTLTENELNTGFMVMYPKRVLVTLTSNGARISETKLTTTLKRLSTGAFDQRYFSRADKVLNIDHVNTQGQETVNTYDAFGNVTTTVVKTGTVSGETVTPVETAVTRTAFGLHNTPVPARPTSLTSSNTRQGAAQASKTVTYSYTAAGNPATMVEFPWMPKATTGTYSYDGFGNVTQAVYSATGLGSRTEKYTYDAKGRFINKKEWIGAGINRSESYTYEVNWARPLTFLSTDGLTTTYTYDAFGREKTVKTPQGYTVSHSLVWDLTAPSVYYNFKDYPAGKADEKTWYDLLGRVTKTQTLGFNNEWITQTTTFNVKGLVATQSNPYAPSETPLVTTNTYDDYNRLTKATNTVSTTDYTYTNQQGRLQVASKNGAGQTRTILYDAAQRALTSTDAGGNVAFTYDSWGNETAITAAGVAISSASFDAYGRQTALTEKNSGSYSYEYDAFGLLRKEQNPNGHFYALTYDDLGRLKTRKGPEGTTTYDYYVNGAYSNDNLQKITGFNGVTKEYTYDAYRRLQTEKVTVDAVAYSTTYAYDAYNNLTQTTYPSGVVVQNVYDGNGHLTTVKGGAAGAPNTLFTGTKLNSFGEYTNYTLGNGKAGQNTYTNGIPARFYTAGIQDLNFTFEDEKFNLLSRKDAIRNITETFQYDALNRLTTSIVNGTQQVAVAYDGSLSASNPTKGNIISKTNAGNYVYRNDKVHAVAYITNPAGATTPPAYMSTTQQDITYTPFQKAAMLKEGSYQLDLTYGPDYERIKTALKQNNAVVETKYFLGDYEKQVAGSTTREIHYVAGGNGLCAMIVRENGVNNFYFTYLDHQGSIVRITDVNGNTVAEQNFDAWGRMRNPTNWQYVAVPAGPAWLYRGFTGHEQLPPFALTNMNGRLYDPITGRMLSPDSYVPDPLSAQGYNRYAYANNNPLLYVDPDGNWWFLIPFAISAATNIIDNWGDISDAYQKGGFWKAFGKAAAYGVVGGVGGLASYYLGKVPVVGGIVSNLITSVGNDIIKGNGLDNLGTNLKNSVRGAAMSSLIGAKLSPITDKLGGWAANKISNQLIKTGVESIVSNFGSSLAMNIINESLDGNAKWDWYGIVLSSAKSAVLSGLVDMGSELTTQLKERKQARQQVAAPAPTQPLETVPPRQPSNAATETPPLMNPPSQVTIPPPPPNAVPQPPAKMPTLPAIRPKVKPPVYIFDREGKVAGIRMY